MESEYPLKLEIELESSGDVITYTDEHPEVQTLLMQRHSPTGELREEQLLVKGPGATIEDLQRQWEGKLSVEAREDHQGEQGPFDSAQELAQDIQAAAGGLDALVGRLEGYLDHQFDIDLSEARYQLRVAAEMVLCAAHRTEDLANG